jgi:hypothetical protein
MRYRLRTLMIAALAGFAITGVALFAQKALRPRMTYMLTADCYSMPSDDETLEKWIRSQPGVINARVERAPRAIRLEWTGQRDIRGFFNYADFVRTLNRFGYKDVSVPYEYGLYKK